MALTDLKTLVDLCADCKVKGARIKKVLDKRMELLNRRLPNGMSVIGDKNFKGFGIFKGWRKPASNKQVINDLARFISIIQRNPEFIEILSPIFSISANQVSEICQKKSIINPFAEIIKEVPKEGETIQVTKAAKGDI